MTIEEIKKIVCDECSQHWAEKEMCENCPATETISHKIFDYISEALSANNEKWEEKIEKFFITPEWDYSEREIRINIDDWNKLLSQMKEGK